ncbi:2OG-Fe(II) oxygenase family protein [Luteimonas sp. S4-F44]|uniref:putative 2OG-Fe(II) oxygenase n=1 Tax=Luteimonas sp. S4-F44 TaxID=2925842 RepID=UPI001F52E633|nr:putative 2OG-Fe(II) oxygenase [Luteimonas sp. S4-F44]UNK43227.1 2OG-Fe(II) oxygenase family protein [Luteimonas sp. S4-F44]
MSSIITAFAVPIISVHLDDCSELNAALRSFFVGCMSQGDKYANPEPFTHRNSALFESQFTLFEWRNPAVVALRDFCWANLYQAIGKLNDYDLSTLRRLHIAHESWFHVTHKGGYFGVHNHPMHSWSGVYCVCQEGDEDNPDSGRLTFISPYASNTMFVDMTSHKLKPPYQLGGIPIRLQPGQLVLFPSWLLHEVTPFDPVGEGLRITVAFNTRFKLLGVEPPKAPVGL